MPKAEHYCAKRAHVTRGDTGYSCARIATIDEDGRWWCWQHAPSAEERRKAASDAKYATESAARNRKRDIEKAEAIVVDAAMAWYLDSNKKFQLVDALCTLMGVRGRNV